MAGVAAFQGDIAVGDGSRKGVSGGFNSIRDDTMFRTPQLPHPLNGNGRTAGAGDFGAHSD